jgi:Tol biopolymer transport system component
LILSALACLYALGSSVEHGNVSFDLSPDGKNIVFSGADDDLYLFHLDTRRVDQLTTTEDTESTPAFSPDGESIIYSALTKDRKGACLFSRTLDGKTVRRITNDAGVSDSMPSYSPDGDRIAFVRAHRNRPYSLGGWTWDNMDVYVMRKDGTGLRRVSSHNYYQAASPCFIDGGKTLVYAADGDHPDSGTYLFTVPADGSQPPKRLTAPPNPGGDNFAWGSDPSTSPDGKRLAFISDRAAHFQYDVFVMSPDGTEIRPLSVTKISRYNQEPVFLPDGKGILFLAGTEANQSNRPIFSLWQIDIDGKNPHRIADSGLFTAPLHWDSKR